MKVKEEFRQILFYKKYQYKLVLSSPGIHTRCFYRNYVTFLRYMEKAQIENPRHRSKDYDLDEIERFDEWREKYPNIKNRAECGRYTIFVNEIEGPAAEEFLQITKTVECFKAVTGPEIAGVRYFKTPPKYKFRAYFKEYYCKNNEKADVTASLQGMKFIMPSRAFAEWMKKSSSGWDGWLLKRFYIDFDEESTYTLLQIMTDCKLDKIYKLEMLK